MTDKLAVQEVEPASREKHKLIYTDHHDTRGITPLHVSVVQALARVIGVDPIESPFVLRNHVAPEALDRITEHGKKHERERSSITFHYDDYDPPLFVHCRSNGDIHIYEKLKMLL